MKYLILLLFPISLFGQYGEWQYETIDSLTIQREWMVGRVIEMGGRSNSTTPIRYDLIHWIEYKMECYIDSTRVSPEDWFNRNIELIGLLEEGAITREEYRVELKRNKDSFDSGVWLRRTPTAEGFLQYKLKKELH